LKALAILSWPHHFRQIPRSAPAEDAAVAAYPELDRSLQR